uniref:Ankyrin repeat domain 13A n=1 Tax=Amphilophus citrinellus TaxID=61819 RepID=A0A3Q0SAI2_AMPCI
MANISEDIRVKFPLHSAVWENDYRKLEQLLTSTQAVDPRGRTPLHLAVSLGHLELVRVLLRRGAQVTKENANNWTVLQEAVSTGDPEMVQLVLQRRDYLKASTALGGVPELLSKIRESPDFYMEMKWEFTSWIPLVSRVCPSDVCRIWKSGASLRVDITLLGFENMTWTRGRRSYIFRGDDSFAELMEVNHDDEVVDIERFNISQEIEDVTLESMQPAEQEVAKRLTTPIVNTYLDTKDIAFERMKSGLWGWRTDKTEVVNGFEAKVFSVNNVNVVIRTRTEHLTDEEKARIKSERNVLESLLGTVEQHINAQGDLTLEYATANNPTAITPEEYFDPDFDLGKRDIGRPIELSIRTQKFKGTLWMSEDHPLSLVEQVTPIIDLMARTSSHFARLRDFVTLKFPPGFPVKIAPPPFQVCPSVFEVPATYHCRGSSRHMPVSNNDEELLQYAIHQSLLESRQSPGQVGAIAADSQIFSYDFPPAAHCNLDTSSSASAPSSDSDLRLAMELSARAQEEEERVRKQEEEELERILQLSLTDK